MQHPDPLAVVQAWQDAANRQEIDRLVELSTPEIEIAGPRGSGQGRQLVQDWLGRAGLSLQTLRAFVRGNLVVVAQKGWWRSVETGAMTGEASIASWFRVEGERIASFRRYESLSAALAAAGLTEEDEMSPG